MTALRRNIHGHLRDRGYLHYKLLQCKDYGVPQNRPRILVIGIRKDINSNIDKSDFFPKKDKTYPHLEDLIGDLLDKNYNTTDKSYNFTDFNFFKKLNSEINSAEKN